MLHKTSRVLVFLVVATALTLGAALTASAYIDQTNLQIILSGPSGTVKCNRSATISAKVVGTKNGKPVRNQLVRWSLSGSQSSGDGISSGSTVTDRRGRTSIRVSFGPVAGARRVTASASNVSPSVTVRCAGGLPRTAPVPPDGFVDEPSGALLRPPTVLEPAPTVLPMSRVRVDRLGIDVGVVEGDGVSVPHEAAAHYPGTAWPGQGSNSYLYAHARDGHFRELWQVRTGDLVEVDMADGSVAEYEVTEIHPVVEWDALEYLGPTDGERLTLQTCLTYDDTAPRFIVIAEPVSV